MSAALISAAQAVVDIDLNDGRAREAAYAALRSALAAGPEQCIGRDPLCPCQDGAACHYKDTPTTKAWPAPEQAPVQPDAWRWRWPATPEYKATPWEYKDTAPAVLAQANGDKPEIEALAVIKGLKASHVPKQMAKQVPVWCDTCEGAGKVEQESQRGGPGSGGKFECPDCDGRGFNVRAYYADPKTHAAPTVESAIAALVTALCESKGWLRDYADSVVRDAIDRKPAAPIAQPLTDDDPAQLWAEIHRLRAAVAGPDGFASWKDAATSERVRRVRAIKALKLIHEAPGEESFEYRRIALLALANDERAAGIGAQEQP